MQNHTLEILQKNYPGSIFLSIRQTALALAIKYQTLNNELSRKIIHLKTVKRGRRRLVHIGELARYIDELNATSAGLPKKRGRPRKVMSVGGDA